MLMRKWQISDLLSRNFEENLQKSDAQSLRRRHSRLFFLCQRRRLARLYKDESLLREFCNGQIQQPGGRGQDVFTAVNWHRGHTGGTPEENHGKYPLHASSNFCQYFWRISRLVISNFQKIFIFCAKTFLMQTCQKQFLGKVNLAWKIFLTNHYLL